VLNRANVPYPYTSLRFFLDEFDSQPTVSEFSASKLQTFVNACYDNAPRSRAGNETDFVQLVVAMNKSWNEFESAYGVHVARRIAEMCVRIDFDKDVVTPPASPRPAMNTPDAIDLLIESSAIGRGTEWQGGQNLNATAQEHAGEAALENTEYDVQYETQDETQDDAEN
jgi:hypothetical protein